MIVIKVRTTDGKLREGVRCDNGKWRVKICGVNVYLRKEDILEEIMPRTAP